MGEYTGPKVGVGIVIRDDRDRILIMLRGEDARNEQGKWDLPGGGVEAGEKLEDAMRREVLEELQFELSFLHLAGIIEHSAEDGQWVSVTFAARPKDLGDIPVVPENEKGKIAKIRWADKSELTRLYGSESITQSLRTNMERKYVSW